MDGLEQLSTPTRDIVVVHSSDLHIDHGFTAQQNNGDGAAGLVRVLAAAKAIAADLVLLAGDTFESHRLPDALIARSAMLIADATLPVVLLPGNHDPVVAGAVYRHTALADLANLHVLGVRHDEAVTFPEFDLEIWGRAHRDYADMIPFERVRARTTRWQIAAGHGHYQPEADRSTPARPSWLISDAELAATAADYVALGHWNRAARVGNGAVPAFYSGSPDYAGSVNVVRLSAAGDVQVTREALPA